MDGQWCPATSTPGRERLIADFIERGAVEGLDLSCIKAGKTVPFVTDAAKIPRQGS